MSQQTSTARKQPASDGLRGDAQQVISLIRQMGSSKGYDPIPPDQYLTYQDSRYAPALRLWAWLLSNTIRQGHRSPFAIDGSGKTLRLEHATADLKMDSANVRRAWRDLEDEKRVYRDGDGRLCVRGDVTLPAVSEGEEKATKVCTDLFPPYISKQINKLPPERRKQFLELHAADAALQKRVQAEFVAGVRCIFDQRQDSRFQEFGVKKIREEKRREPTPDFAKTVLPAVERFVQTSCESVQTSKAVCTNGSASSVQTSASLLTSEVTETEKNSSSSSPLACIPGETTTTNGKTNGHGNANTLEAAIDLKQVLEALAHYCTPDEAGARTLLLNCRSVVKDVTADEICHFIHLKGKLAAKKTSPFGFLMIAVPNCLNGEPFQQWRREQLENQAAESRPTAPVAAVLQIGDQDYDQLLAEQRAVLSNPEASENDKRLARRLLGVEAR